MTATPDAPIRSVPALEDEAAPGAEAVPKQKRLALVCSKGNMDEVYPILIMASTAGALGWETGVFCTFYGLDVVNKKRVGKAKVSAIGNPASPPPFKSVPFKVPSILGVLPGAQSAATWFMKRWMKKSNIPDMDDLMQICVESGVQFYACATTMGVMGVSQDDIIDGVSCLGATAFLDFASEAELALFV